LGEFFKKWWRFKNVPQKMDLVWGNLKTFPQKQNQASQNNSPKSLKPAVYMGGGRVTFFGGNFSKVWEL
jgi:hypothetical protein